jgi:predicted ATP-grasp superfamily ATP-dependent carboligase
LTGLFGVDFVLAGDEAWPVEVNPRWTASVEVIERIAGFCAARIHIDAACHGRLPERRPLPAPGRFAGKRILFAKHGVRIDERLVADCVARNAGRDVPSIADISPAGTEIPPGGPVVTLLAGGDSPSEVGRRLDASAARVEAMLRDIALPARGAL